MFRTNKTPVLCVLSLPGRFAPGSLNVALLFLLAISSASTALAQLQTSPRQRLPVINRITSNGPARSAVTGRVQSLDPKLKVLDVSTANGQSTVIFPLNKKIRVSSITGQKLKLAAVAPGSNVIVYYEQQDARRTVQQIIVLGNGEPQTKKHSHPS